MNRLLIFFGVVAGAISMGGFKHQVDGRADGMAEELGGMLNQILASIGTCHLALVTLKETSILLSATKYLNVLDIQLYQVEQDVPLEKPWDQISSSCKVLLLDFTAVTGKEAARDVLFPKLLSVPEAYHLSKTPEVYVVVAGPKSGLEVVVHHPSLRNSEHVLYLALGDLLPLHIHNAPSRLRQRISKSNGKEVSVYSRCLYCNNGNAGIRLLSRQSFTPGAPMGGKFWNGQDDCMGHKFRIVGLEYTPFSEYTRETEDPGTQIQLLDSFESRLLVTLSRHLNFTYVIREQADGHWGIPLNDGNWTGIVGTLQHERADFAFGLTHTHARSPILDFTRIYIDDPVVIVSAKPRSLPNYLSLISPFSENVWLLLTMSILVFGLILCFLWMASESARSGHEPALSSALLFAWRTILDVSTNQFPLNGRTRLLVAMWLICCIIMTTAYRSSLVAHLTVQEKEAAIDSFKDLVEAQGWSWGTDSSQGVFNTYLTTSSDPMIAKLGREVQMGNTAELMAHVFSGCYAYLTSKHYITSLIASNYTDKFGNSDVYVGREEYKIFSGISLGFRKGMPLRTRLCKLLQRLLEAGLVDHWMDEVHLSKEKRFFVSAIQSDRVQLGLGHLQGAFLLHLLGCTVSFLVLLAEVLAHRRTASYTRESHRVS